MKLGIGQKLNPLKDAINKSKTTFISVALFSAAVNILMLTGPMFMLQVYDRVLASRSVPTLVALFSLVAGLYLSLGFFDFIRSRTLSRAGYRLDTEMMVLTKKVWIFSGIAGGKASARPLSDLSTIRQFLCSNGLPALFDLPWVPIYLIIVYLLHFWLGLLATAGAIIVIIATIITELITKKPIGEAMTWEIQDAKFADASNRNAEAIVAMGMVGKVTSHWQGMRNKALSFAQKASGRTEYITAFTKAMRMLVQSGMLALGAYLVIYQEITPGTMIAASILGGRALAPIDLAVGNWKSLTRARHAFRRLSAMLSTSRDQGPPVQLPAPKGEIEVDNVFKLAPQDDTDDTRENRAILQNVHFVLHPGDALGVVGPSASGKSTLARLLVGLWMPEKGSIRLDSATYDQWDRDELGKYIGYLPQSVELMSGTVSQNISRFELGAEDDDIVAAAKMAGVHKLILKLPDGYSTLIGIGAYVLSGGQAQRIALARAIFRTPPLVVLDEPNANLDAEGDAALTSAIEELRKVETCVIVMAHRPSAIAAVNKVLMLNDGFQVEFGLKEDVLKRVTRQGPDVAREAR